ncbi:response regulator [Betaproteobacteria bacterium PRO7]|jgi:DNA-binding NtrC family response regulator|nr:response regulator [Betaproteobacteria bacterium PRO7]GIL06077.1 MAG: two-component system response regulator [Betaproteobacteria bacterium]
MATILVVDDEIGIRELLSEILSDEGHAVLTAENASVARQLRQSEPPDLVLLDIWMPDTDGVTLLKEWASNGQLTMPVIMMSGHATIDTAVEATRFGALDFLEKPIALARLLAAVKSGLERGRMMRNLRAAPALATAAAQPAESVNGVDGARVRTVAGAESTGVSLDQPLREARDQFERVYFEYHLARENYSMTRVADRAGLERTHLYRKLKQLGVELGRGGRRAERNGHETDGEAGGGST